MRIRCMPNMNVVKCFMLPSRCSLRYLRNHCLLYIFIIFSFLCLIKLFHSMRYGTNTLRSMVFNFPYFDSSRFFFNNHFYRNESQFIAGAFINDLEPANESYCSFRLGFPDFFDLSDSEINLSPELGVNSPYRVIYNVLQGSGGQNNSNNITYCSHLTPDFLFYLTEIVVRWEGPISIAAFVPSYDASTTLCLLQRLCLCIPEMSKVSLHFVFPVKYPPEHVSCDPTLLKTSNGCFVPNVIFNKRLETFRSQESLIYPVNVARNVARTSAKTRFVLVSDIELIPSKSLISRFLKMVPKLLMTVSYEKTLQNQLVYVLPVFEVDGHILKIPEKKSELLDLYSQNKAVYFHRWICLHCQRFPGLQRWIHHSSFNLDNNIQPMLVVRREFPFHRWEPIYIGTNAEPLYSERLSWEGKQDKMIQMHEMCLMGYRFVILDGAFLVHAPGIKRRSSLETRTSHHFENMQHYEEIMRQVTKKQGTKHGCRTH